MLTILFLLQEMVADVVADAVVGTELYEQHYDS